MNKTQLKKTLKPLIKECIKEVIFEEGILSGIITEVAKGLKNSGNVSLMETKQRTAPQRKKPNNGALLEARKQLEDTKRSLQESVGLGNVFEGTTPMHQAPNTQDGQYGSFRDRDPSDAGVDISGLLKLTGGWKV